MRISTKAVGRILQARESISDNRCLLVAVTGIDGSGKGFVTAQITKMLEAQSVSVAAINIDGWLNLPSRRFDPKNPARHFYEQGIRFPEMFDRLVLPLRKRRSLRLNAELTDASNLEEYREHPYQIEDVDVILLDGIFLLKKAFRIHYDLSFWIDCTFETALERALARDQEGLPRDELIRDYETIYFPAQRIHLSEDQPKEAATSILPNDPRLEASSI